MLFYGPLTVACAHVDQTQRAPHCQTIGHSDHSLAETQPSPPTDNCIVALVDRSMSCDTASIAQAPDKRDLSPPMPLDKTILLLAAFAINPDGIARIPRDHLDSRTPSGPPVYLESARIRL